MNLKFKNFFLVTVITSINLVSTLNSSVLQLGLLDLSKELHVSYENVSIIVSIYWLSAGITALISGRLGDVFSPQRVFKVSLVLFALTGLPCLVVNSLPGIAVLRVIQGVAVSAAVTNGLPLMKIAHKPEEITQMMGIWVASISLGYIIGPSAGGLMTGLIGWRVTLAMLSGVIGISSIFAFIFLPNQAIIKRNIDILELVLLAIFTASLLLLLSPVRKDGWKVIEFSFLGTVLIASLIAFWYRQKHLSEPTFDIKSIKNNKNLLKCLVCGFSFTAALQGIVFLLPLYLQSNLGFSVSESGLFWMLMSLANLIGSLLVGKLTRNFTNYQFNFFGTVIRIFATGLMAAIVATSFIYAGYAILGLLFLLGFGLGITTAPLFSILILSTDKNSMGIVSGIYNTVRNISGAIGVAISSQILAFSASFQNKTNIPIALALFGMTIITFIALPYAKTLKLDLQ